MVVFQKFLPGIPTAVLTTRWVRYLSIEKIILNTRSYQILLLMALYAVQEALIQGLVAQEEFIQELERHKAFLQDLVALEHMTFLWKVL